MKRKIISIDEKKCNGCALCVNACHEGAIGIVNGKAKLLRDDYCDGLGDCLPACPMNAISFVTRQASSYDEKAVAEHKQAMKEKKQEGDEPLACGCPGTHAKIIEHAKDDCKCENTFVESKLSQWPVQIKLVAPNAKYFDSAQLLIAADCSAYAYGNFHNDFIRDHITLIGCPKLDDIDYSDKLTDILSNNDIKSITIVRMEVPCCSGLEHAVQTAINNSKKNITCKTIVITTDGKISQ